MDVPHLTFDPFNVAILESPLTADLISTQLVSLFAVLISLFNIASHIKIV